MEHDATSSFEKRRRETAPELSRTCVAFARAAWKGRKCFHVGALTCVGLGPVISSSHAFGFAVGNSGENLQEPCHEPLTLRPFTIRSLCRARGADIPNGPRGLRLKA